MRLSNLWSLLLVVLLLSGCGSMVNTTYTFVPPKDNKGKMCIMQCQHSKNLCQRLCDSDTENCKSRALTLARADYDAYLNEQRQKGQPADKDLNDFYSSPECKKQCNCSDDYRSCYQLCGGEVISQSEW